MSTDPDPHLLNRVLALALNARDAEWTRGLAAASGAAVAMCASLAALTGAMAAGAGALLVTEEILAAPESAEYRAFLQGLAQQPPWSDIPIILLIRGGDRTVITAEALAALRHVTLLEHPVSQRAAGSAIQAALRARQRQYQLRDRMAELQRGARERDMLLDSERAARTEAERANRIKDEFLATVSHELRTPLNAILGWAQILARTPDDVEEVLAGLEVIERNARLQSQLIEELLDMSRIISGKIRLELRPLEPAGVIRSAIASVQPAAEAKRIRITQALDPIDCISADASRLQQILWNLLSNAVKFTPSGGEIRVSARQIAPFLRIEVSDTGKGLDAEFIPHVFERFRQADASLSRTHGGLGLGLAIVKHLVDLHGGAVSAASDGLNRGTTFTLSFPLLVDPVRKAQPAARSAGAPRFRDHADLAGVRVLVVDDDSDARRLTWRLLTECRADVTTAASAREALSLLSTLQPHVLVSDIGMPEMDGYQFIREVRGFSGEAARMPAIAVTAFARAEDREQALRAGYQKHLPKPIAPAEFLAAVAALAGREPRMGALPAGYSFDV